MSITSTTVPVNQHPSSLSGSGEIGTLVTATPGQWQGAAHISGQWLRDGTPILGATGLLYTPSAVDDLANLSYQETATNEIGSTSVQSAALTMRYVPPVASGALPDEIFDLDSGLQKVAVLGDFTGDNLRLSVSGAWAVLDPDDMVCLPTEAERSCETVTVVAQNSGGQAQSRFLVTVEDPTGISFDPATLSNCSLHLDFSDFDHLTIVEDRVANVRDRSPLAATYEQIAPTRRPVVAFQTMNGFEVLNFNYGGLSTSTPPLVREVFIVWRALRDGERVGKGTGSSTLALIGHATPNDHYSVLFKTGTVDISVDGQGNVAGRANANGGAFSVGRGAASKNLDIPGLDETNRLKGQLIRIKYYSDYNVSDIGRVVGRTELFLDGDLAEVVGYFAPLEDSDGQKVEGHLAHKWGLADKLPADHPYKDGPPSGIAVFTPGQNPAVTDPAASVSFNFTQSDGVTPQDLTTGQFADDSWYVVKPADAPVRIGSIEPAYMEDEGVPNGKIRSISYGTRQRNGAMLNPTRVRETGGEPQFDNWNLLSSTGTELMDGVGQIDPDATGQVLEINTSSTVVKAVGATSVPTENITRGNIARYALLTVLEDSPPAGSFRPPVASDLKPIQAQISDIDHTMLQSLDISGAIGASFANFVAGYLARSTFQTWSTREEPSRKDVARLQWPSYGRDQAYIFGTACLYLHDNQPDAVKEPLAIAICQMALDILAAIKAGSRYGPDGGHEIGRKSVLAMGAALLRNTDVGLEMAQWCDPAQHPDIFQEDSQYFTVGQSDVDRVLQNDSNGRPAPISYQNAHLGWPEWGLRHSTTPASDSANIDVYYRGIGVSVLGAALAAHMCDGGEALFADSTTLQAQDRFLFASQGGFSFGQQYDRAHVAVYNAYRDTATTLAVWTGNPEMPLPPQIDPAGSGELDVTRQTPQSSNGLPIIRRDLRYSTDQSNWTEVLGVFGSGDSHRLSGLTRGITYYIQTRDVNRAARHGGLGPWSTNVVERVGGSAPQATGIPT